MDLNLVYSAGLRQHQPGEPANWRTWKEHSPLVFSTKNPPADSGWPCSSSRPIIRTSFTTECNTFISRDQGNTWKQISPDLSKNDLAKLGDIQHQTLFSISESPLRFGVIYAGTDDGRLHLTRDDGATWTELTAKIAPDRWISRVIASKYKMGRVYVAQNGKRDDDFQVYLWKSEDYGNTFTNISQIFRWDPST
ncbi:MAG: hypothetical protein MZV63_31920 [Marinilabiliales bacterium]|nr:hypothetical protein [Marinilabiliales bacterium]